MQQVRSCDHKLSGVFTGRLSKLGLAKWFTSQAQMLYAAEHNEVRVCTYLRLVHRGQLLHARSAIRFSLRQGKHPVCRRSGSTRAS